MGMLQVQKYRNLADMDDAAGANLKGAKLATLSTAISPPFTSSQTMAIARPIRMLGATCILLALFLVFQLRQGSDGSSSRLTRGMSRDPLLDRAFTEILQLVHPFPDLLTRRSDG